MNLEEMREIEQAATEGPWIHWPEAHSIEIIQRDDTGHYGEIIDVRPRLGWGEQTYVRTERNPGGDEPDAAFIAASRTFVPDALDALETILELHSHEVYDSHRRMCSACGGTVPCATRRIIENKLGVQE